MFMKKRILNLLSVLALLLLVVNCAKRSSPTGGPKDEDPPVFVNANPPNYTTNFEEDEIRVYFDEYIKFKDLQKQLIISPPINPKPLITPLGSASKYISITVEDTALVPNTTYVFNFGRSVVDNNEGNPYPYFKYVMSTGDYIDSLKVRGEIRDALLALPDEYVTVMLYEVDSTYKDSVVYKDQPRYVTNTLDSTTTFELTNLKAGKYRLVALKDEDENYTFQPDKDKIGFVDDFITLPRDTAKFQTLTLFNEILLTQVERPRQPKAQRVNFAYAGVADSIDINLLSPRPEGFESLITYRKDEDTLKYWYKPKIETDSLVFNVVTPTQNDTLVLRKRPVRNDSLIFSPETRNAIALGSNFRVKTNIPITGVDTTKITIAKLDSTYVNDFKVVLVPRESRFSIDFDTEENQTYTITALPEAFTDFLGHKNDTLRFAPRTAQFSDFGDFEITLAAARDSTAYIVQLTTDKGEVKLELAGEPGQTVFTFNTVGPAQYLIRVIEDANGNGKFDTGNFLKGLQPEKVFYYPEIEDIRKGWFPKKIFTLSPSAEAPLIEEQTNPDLPEN